MGAAGDELETLDEAFTAGMTIEPPGLPQALVGDGRA
jgi:hypothetical protein